MAKAIRLDNDTYLDAESVSWGRRKLNDTLYAYIPKMRATTQVITPGNSYTYQVINVSHSKLLHFHIFTSNYFVDRLYTLMGENGWVHVLHIMDEQNYLNNSNANFTLTSNNNDGVLELIITNTGSVNLTFDIEQLIFENNISNT